MKTVIAAAAVALTAGVAQALPPAPATPAAGATVATSASTAAAPSTKRLCILEDLTGSRLPVKTCKTAAEWDALGVKYTVRR